ncbi:hypothetical protein EC957_000915 [Mortierella hygrophila]|uniref:Uncharacterized protein n=1 Tax=Mortierella hygrophila TaxID=979708 RepID=A0A9P6F6E5_9FUNG|nr:hypothetical protein EC957_000915 [Mortierella hygrophila]
MDGIFPVCYTTIGGYVYTAAYDTRQNRAQARLIVAQSKYYPTSLSDLTWDAIGEVPQDLIRAAAFEDYTYNCAWNNDTGTFALLGQTLAKSSMTNTTSRFGIEFSTAFSGGVVSPPTKRKPLPYLEFETDPYRPVDTIVEGRSVLVPVEGVEGAVVKGDGVGNGKAWGGGGWVHAQYNVTSRELLFKTFRYDQVFYEAPQVAWSMDAYAPFVSGIIGRVPGTRDYRLIAHSNTNNKLYVIGSSVANGTLLVTTLPLNPKNLGQKPLTVAQPEPYQGPTIDSDLGKDCDLNHPWSTASVHNSQLFVLCYPKIEAEQNKDLQLFLFNGTIFQKIASITLTTVSTTDHGPHIVPIPFNPTKDTKAATWAYLSVNFGRRGYVIDLTGFTTGGGIGGTISTDGRVISQPFVLSPENPYLSNDIYKDGARPRIPIAAWVGGFLALLFIILFAVWVVYRHRVRTKEARRQEMIANGMDPDMNPETVGGVTRTQHGDDASDALPLYTLRAPSVPFMVQQPTDHSAPTVTAVGTAIATATVAATATASAGAAVAATPIPATPEPSDLPPGYSPDLSTPRNGQQEDTRSVCIDSETNSVNTPAADTVLTTDASTAQGTTDVPTAVEGETIATTPPHPSTTASDNKTNL